MSKKIDKLQRRVDLVLARLDTMAMEDDGFDETLAELTAALDASAKRQHEQHKREE